MEARTPERFEEPDLVLKALLLHGQGRFEEARSVCSYLENTYSPHWMARSIDAIIRSDEAGDDVGLISTLESTLEHFPEQSGLRLSLGMVLVDVGQYADAFRHLQQIPEEDMPAEGLISLGFCHLAVGERRAALDHFERALYARPSSRGAEFQAMYAAHILRPWREAWERHESRWDVPGYRRQNGIKARIPPWNGTRVGRLLVTDEQGAGDTIQFARFLRPISGAAAEIVCRIRDDGLRSLLATSFPDVLFIKDDSQIPEIDAHLPLCSAVHRLRVPESQLSDSGRYLTAPGPHPSLSRPLVGLCWAGSRRHRRDRSRSIPWDQFRQLLSYGDCLFVNLTVGRSDPVPETVWTPSLPDYIATANVVAACNLVITCDTSILHLCGALGVRTVALLPAVPDFRWGLERRDTPWYPSVSLIRQKDHSSWEEPVAEAGKSLMPLHAS